MVMFATTSQAKMTLALSNVNTNLLTPLIKAASAQVETYLNTKVDNAERTETYNGKGLQSMGLRVRPMISLGDIVITDGAGGTTTVTSDNFTFDTDPDSSMSRIAFAPGNTSSVRVFTRGFNNISVTYTAGYATVPDEIVQATILITTGLYIPTASPNPQFVKERLGEYESTLVAPTTLITPTVAAMLERYRLIRI